MGSIISLLLCACLSAFILKGLKHNEKIEIGISK